MRKTKIKITVVLVLLLAVMLGYLVYTINSNKEKKAQTNSIKSSITENDYTSGIVSEDGYESAFWNLRIMMDNNWEMLTEDELESSSQSIRETNMSAAVENMQKNNVSQSIINKWVDTAYVKMEMGALYKQDDVYVGECSLVVQSAYLGEEERVIDSFVEATEESLKEASDKVSTGVQKIAGTAYREIQATVNVDGQNLTTHIFVTIKNSKICMITCRYAQGYEHILDSMLSMIEKY